MHHNGRPLVAGTPSRLRDGDRIVFGVLAHPFVYASGGDGGASSSTVNQALREVILQRPESEEESQRRLASLVVKTIRRPAARARLEQRILQGSICVAEANSIADALEGGRTFKLCVGSVIDGELYRFSDALSPDVMQVTVKCFARNATKPEFEATLDDMEGIIAALRDIYEKFADIAGGDDGDGDVAARIFEAFDRDESGTIDVQEMGGALAALGVRTTPEAVAAVLEQHDTDGSQDLDLPEFRKFVRDLVSKTFEQATRDFAMAGGGEDRDDEQIQEIDGQLEYLESEYRDAVAAGEDEYAEELAADLDRLTDDRERLAAPSSGAAATADELRRRLLPIAEGIRDAARGGGGAVVDFPPPPLLPEPRRQPPARPPAVAESSFSPGQRVTCMFLSGDGEQWYDGKLGTLLDAKRGLWRVVYDDGDTDERTLPSPNVVVKPVGRGGGGSGGYSL